MLIVSAYQRLSSRRATKATIFLGVSAISLIVSFVLRYMRSEEGAYMVLHVGLMTAAAVLMFAGIAFLRKARAYHAQAERFGKIFHELGKSPKQQ